MNTATAATASASASAARGGKGVPAESRSVGKGRRIEAVKSGGRDGLIGGDGRESFGVDRHVGSFSVDGHVGKGISKSIEALSGDFHSSQWCTYLL